MFVHTYTKFFSFIVGAFAFSFLGLEIVGNGLPASSSVVTGYAVQETTRQTLGASNLILLFIGVFLGALIAIGLVYLYHVESNRFD